MQNVDYMLAKSKLKVRTHNIVKLEWRIRIICEDSLFCEYSLFTIPIKA